MVTFEPTILREKRVQRIGDVTVRPRPGATAFGEYCVYVKALSAAVRINENPTFPEIRAEPSDPFLLKVQASGRKWIVLQDQADDQPKMVMDSDAFLRDALFRPHPFRPLAQCHRPIVTHDPDERLGTLLPRLHVKPRGSGDDVVDHGIVLLWGEHPRVATGADLLGRLLRGIARVESGESCSVVAP